MGINHCYGVEAWMVYKPTSNVRPIQRITQQLSGYWWRIKRNLVICWHFEFKGQVHNAGTALSCAFPSSWACRGCGWTWLKQQYDTVLCIQGVQACSSHGRCDLQPLGSTARPLSSLCLWKTVSAPAQINATIIKNQPPVHRVVQNQWTEIHSR